MGESERLVGEILSALARSDEEAARLHNAALRRHIRENAKRNVDVRPYGWSADQCAAFVAAFMVATDALSR